MNKFKELKPFNEKSGAIGQDIILDVPDRVAKNSVRLREVENAVKQARKNQAAPREGSSEGSLRKS